MIENIGGNHRFGKGFKIIVSALFTEFSFLDKQSSPFLKSFLLRVMERVLGEKCFFF